MAKKESNEPLTDKSPRYRILEYINEFYPQWLKRTETAYGIIYEYINFQRDPYAADSIKYPTMGEAKDFIRGHARGEVIHSFDPETE